MKKNHAISVVFMALTGCVWAEGISTIKELDDAALFSFAVFGDHHGASPNGGTRRENMARLDAYVKAHDQFVIGAGDHILKYYPEKAYPVGNGNSFVNFIEKDSYWNNHFYPAIGDHDNQYEAELKQNWGFGWKLFTHLHDFFNRPNVEFRQPGDRKIENGGVLYDDRKVDYYARFDNCIYPGIPAGYTVHLISLHFGNQLVFAPQTRDFMVNKFLMLSAVRTNNDIILLVSQAQSEFMEDIASVIDESQKKLILQTADFIIEGNSHTFRRHPRFDSEYPNGAVCLNVGTVILDNPENSRGYLNFHVLADPVRVTVQYIDLDAPERKLHTGPVSANYMNELSGPWIKTIGGSYQPVDWSLLDLTK
ncbi:MAG: hypothetical protein MUC65_10390 [Pontiellaceae bacterium]|nr:hypothetical protein [Pontiellaceae bacterium]